MSREDDATSPPAGRQKSPTGRAIVTGAWLVVVAATSVVTVTSVLRDLYGSPPPQAKTTFTDAERDWCVRRLTGLKADIQSHVTNELQRPPLPSEPVARWRTWLESWTDSFSIAANRCRAGGEPMSEAFERLRDLSATYDAGVDRILRARTDLGQEIDASARVLSGH